MKLLAKIDVSELKAVEAQTGSQRLMQECIAIHKLCIEALTDCEKGAFAKAREAITAIIGLENTLRTEIAKRANTFDTLLGGLDEVVLFRGVNQPNIHGRIGRWWSTDPFYALRYSGGGRGFFVAAKVLRRDIEKLAKDAGIEADFENFFFGSRDPPNARQATAEEVKVLYSYTSEITVPSVPGGKLWRRPLGKEAVEIGRRLFLGR